MTNEPIAWLACATDASESSFVTLFKEQAEAAARDWGWSVVPLAPLAAPEQDATPQQGSVQSQGSVQGWIPVSERLPEVGVTVLGWDRDGYHTLHVYCGKGKSGQDVWFGCNVAGGEYEDGRTAGDPDYWMPLPSPPNEVRY